MARDRGIRRMRWAAALLLLCGMLEAAEPAHPPSSPWDLRPLTDFVAQRRAHVAPGSPAGRITDSCERLLMVMLGTLGLLAGVTGTSRTLAAVGDWLTSGTAAASSVPPDLPSTADPPAS